MDEEVLVPRAEDEGPPELKRVLAEAMLPAAGLPRPSPGDGVGPVEEVEDRTPPQAGRPVRLTVLIDQEREADAGLTTERARVGAVPQAYGGKTHTRFPKGRLVVAQPRDVLAAEDSAVVPEENHHHRGALP